MNHDREQRLYDYRGRLIQTPLAIGLGNLMPRKAVKEITDLCHQYNVLVSTGGFLEYVLRQSSEAVGRYIQECKSLGFDIIEISCGFITIPSDDWVRLVERVQ